MRVRDIMRSNVVAVDEKTFVMSLMTHEENPRRVNG